MPLQKDWSRICKTIDWCFWNQIIALWNCNMDGLDLLATVACAHRDNEIRKGKVGERPTLPQCFIKYHCEILGTTSFAPKCKNKGSVGLELERQLGIPNSSDCLDCAAGVDGKPGGELKAFPVTTASSRSTLRKAFDLAINDYIAKETVAITRWPTYWLLLSRVLASAKKSVMFSLYLISQRWLSPMARPYHLYTTPPALRSH